MTLKTELTADPAALGYDMADAAQIERVINARDRSRIVSHFVSERGVLDRHAGGPVAGDALLAKLEAFAQSAQPLAGIVRRALKFLAQPDGIDLGSAGVQGMLDALTDGGVLTTAERDGLRAMATRSCSRAEELGLPYVTDAMIREALA